MVSVLVVQMNKVLQVELFGVLSEIDGVHILVKQENVRLRETTHLKNSRNTQLQQM